MKKIGLLILFLLIISCSDSDQERNTASDIKYITRNHRDLSTYLKSELRDKQIVHIVYPQYIKESYDLIKYVSFIAKEFGEEGVYLENLPVFNTEETIEVNLLKKAPEFSHSGFISLYTFLKDYEIKFINQIDGDKKIVVLSGNQEDYSKNRELLDKKFKEKTTTLVLAGTEDTFKLRDMINMIPLGKSVGVIPLVNWRFPVLNGKYDSIAFNGEINNYKEVVPLKLYNLENYNEAPASFIEDNKGITENRTIKKMNSYLSNKIAKENRYFKFKEINLDE